jgi:YfiH family protein
MVIEAPELSSPRIRHAFFTRQGGVSGGVFASLNGGLGSGDDPNLVRENRRRMTDRLGLPDAALVSLWQVHSGRAVAVEAPWSLAERPKADGMATRTPGLALGIATADCGPVLFADADAGVVGAAHAGWRGALGGVLEAVLDRMEALGARRRSVVAVLGPTIAKAAYEVGPELRDEFTAADQGNGRFFTKGEADRWLFDLPAYVGARLGKAGVGLFADLGPLHLRRPGALLQLPPHDPSRRAGLRPADLGDRAHGLILKPAA